MTLVLNMRARRTDNAVEELEEVVIVKLNGIAEILIALRMFCGVGKTLWNIAQSTGSPRVRYLFIVHLVCQFMYSSKS